MKMREQLPRLVVTIAYLIIAYTGAINSFLGPRTGDIAQVSPTLAWMTLFAVASAAAVPFHNRAETIYVQNWAILAVAAVGFYGCVSLRHVVTFMFWNTSGKHYGTNFDVEFAICLTAFFAAPLTLIYWYSKLPRLLTGLLTLVILTAPTATVSFTLLSSTSR